jgi:pilus assembly protein CpaB
MRWRILAVITAIVSGLIAVLAVSAYLNSIEAKYKEERKKVSVLVATRDIAKGTPVSEIKRRKLAKRRPTPLKYLVSGYVRTFRQIEGKVTIEKIGEGEQLTSDQFALPQKAGLKYTVPSRHVAVSVLVDESRGVVPFLQPGDKVAVVVTFRSTAGSAFTKILFRSTTVLAVGSRLEPSAKQAAKASAQRAEKLTVTLAVKPSEAEKLIFAAEEGDIWLAMLPVRGTIEETTTGQSAKTIFSEGR